MDSLVLNDTLIDRVLNSNWRREEFLLADFIAKKHHKKYKMMLLGRRSLSSMPDKLKLIDTDSWPIMYTEVAKEYLEYLLEEAPRNRRNVGFHGSSYDMLKLRRPFHLGELKEGAVFAYVDIVSAWPQIFLPSGLDVRFSPRNMTFSPGLVEFLNPDWLLSQKKVYRAIGGLVSCHTITYYKNGKGPYQRNAHQKLLAPNLYGLVMSTLHYCAQEVISNFGAYYWNNDGCIVDVEKAPLVIEYLREAWGLSARIKEEMTSTRKEGNKMCKPQSNVCGVTGTPYVSELARKMKRWRKESLKRFQSEGHFSA